MCLPSLHDVVNPGGLLVLIWLEQFKSRLVSRAFSNEGLTAERATPFCAKSVRTSDA